MNTWESQPIKIGKHEWRMVVRPSTVTPGALSSAHEFRALADGGRWRDYREWPSYNFNDGTYAGLPRSLLTRLWPLCEAKVRELCKRGN